MNIVKIGIKVNFKGRATSACKRFNGNRCNNLHVPTKFLAIDFYIPALLVILAVLVAVFIGTVVLQLFVYSLLLLKSPDKDPESGLPVAWPKRSDGWWLAAGGAGLLGFPAGYVVLTTYLPTWLAKNHGVGMVALGAAITGVYALADGLGVALLRTERVGVVALLWVMVLGLGGWIGSIFW